MEYRNERPPPKLLSRGSSRGRGRRGSSQRGRSASKATNKVFTPVILGAKQLVSTEGGGLADLDGTTSDNTREGQVQQHGQNITIHSNSSIPSLNAQASSSRQRISSPPPRSQYLVSSYFDIRTADCEKLLVDQTNFKVIGVVGTQGIGKSELCCALTENMKAYETHKDANSISKHVTKGIQLFTSKERLLVLDSQPLLSPSVMHQLATEGTPSGLPRDASLEYISTYQSLQTIIFLMNVCHILVILQGSSFDTELLELIRVASFLAQCSPSVVGSHGPTARLVFVQKGGSHEIVPLSHTEEYLRGLISLREETKGIKDFEYPKDESLISVERVESFEKDELLRLCNKLRNVFTIPFSQHSKRLTEKNWLLNTPNVWKSLSRSSPARNYMETLQELGLV